MVRMFIYGGGMNVHGNGITNFAAYADEFGQVFTSCPNAVDSATTQTLTAQLERGLAHYFVL